MTNYNYHVLSPTEFENLGRDLIQRKENIVLETFKEGKDLGIDLRYAEAKDNSLIVQAKRYKNDYEYLYKKLKDDELPKVKRLKPKRYILITSVGLTPSNKEEILKLFGDYILSSADVIGKEDIDNLIGLYRDLEKAHYKLWLTSTNIMQEILHSKQYNQSRFELEAIVDEIKFYVKNLSFEKAQEIISKEKFVVISGIPGIGKTTLARMLAYHYLANGYEDFIHLSENIDGAYSIYVPGKRQLFLYDDFLGENFLSEKLTKNEDKRIISFIEKIKRDEGKILIMTTREYILRQAQIEYPLIEQLKAAKATLELSDYTSLIKAQILFNHLFFNDIDTVYLENIIEESNYLRIINHGNYSPLIIASIAKKKLWEGIKPINFTQEILKYLNNPFEVWENVFETKISNLSQLILLVLSMSGAPMLLEDMRMCAEAHTTVTSASFKAAIRELENTFIVTQADEYGIKAAEFKNNSIQDYLLNYLKSNRSELIKLLRCICFINQGFDMFEFSKTENESGLILIKDFTPITHNDDSLNVLKQVLTEKLSMLQPSSKVIRNRIRENAHQWIKPENNKLHWLVKTVNLFDLEKDIIFRSKLVDIISAIDPYTAEIDNQFSSMLFLRYIVQKYLPTDTPKLIKCMAEKVKNFDELYRFCELGDPYKADFIAFRETEAGMKFKDIALSLCQQTFAEIISVTINPPVIRSFAVIFYKAEMERVCEEINYISERLDLGIYLDSHDYKEYVRSKLKKHALADDFATKKEDEQISIVIGELFASLKH